MRTSSQGSVTDLTAPGSLKSLLARFEEKKQADSSSSMAILAYTEVRKAWQ
jgi:hypothetical protein